MYSIVSTQKDSKAVRFNDNFYRLQKTNKNGTTRWICTNRRCSASLTMNDDIIEAVRGTHNHNQMKRSISISKVIDEMRSEVCENLSKPITQIYNDHVSQYVKTFFSKIDLFRSFLETNEWHCFNNANI